VTARRTAVADLVLRSQRVLIEDTIRPAAIHMRGGRIASVGEWDSTVPGASTVDAGNDIVMPGLVDTHVHINEPGRTEWEGFSSATRAAAAGGVTTLLDMPLNSIPATTSVEALEAKRAAAQGRCSVNVGFIGGVVPGNIKELPALYEAGVRAFKCFLVPSGVDEFPAVGEADLRQALPILARLKATLMVHAELPEWIRPASGASRRYASYLASRPDEAETEAVALVVRLAAEYGARVHIVHLSSERTIPIIHQARRRGVRVTAETCPHYLTFAAEEIADGATELKCAPPVRTAEHREALWTALLNGDIDMVVSDHSPCPPALKQPSYDGGDFFGAWGGIASLQLGLSAVWEGARSRNAAPRHLVEWMSRAPARLAGLDHRKGHIRVGYDADVVVWDPDATSTVGERPLYHRHPVTPYRGRELHGVVRATYVAGRPAYENDTFAEPLAAELLLTEHR
jgi:allantoinase